MKKEEIVTLIIIGIILAIDIGTLAYTKKCVAKITGDLAELEDEAVKYCNEEKNKKRLNDRNLELSSKSEDIYKEWIRMSDILTFYIEHDELEKVNVQFERIIADYSVDSKEEVVPEIKEAIFILNHIEKKQRLTLRNVL